MAAGDRFVLDEMESPAGVLELVAYRDEGTTWVGVVRRGGGLVGAVGLRTGSFERQVSASSDIHDTWAVGWGAVAPGIVRAELRNDDGESFPARIVDIPPELEREYRAVWGMAVDCHDACDLIGFDERGRVFDQMDPRVIGPAPSDGQRLEAIRRHAHDAMRYYATAYVKEADEGRDLVRGYLEIVGDVLALLETDGLDPRSVLARRSKIVARYLEEAGREPWTPADPRRASRIR